MTIFLILQFRLVLVLEPEIFCCARGTHYKIPTYTTVFTGFKSQNVQIRKNSYVNVYIYDIWKEKCCYSESQLVGLWFKKTRMYPRFFNQIIKYPLERKQTK